MRNHLRWGRSILGYLLYSIIIFGVLLWVMFPADFLRQWIPDYATVRFPQLSVGVKEVELHFPGKLVFRDVAIDSAVTNHSLIKLNSLMVQPEPVSLWRLQPTFAYAASLHQGTVNGQISSSGDAAVYDIQGQVQGVQLSTVSMIADLLQREVQGTLSGTYRGQLVKGDQTLQGVDMQMSVDNGNVGLIQPILGHASIPFSHIACSLSGSSNAILIEKGTVASELFSADFTGKVELQLPFSGSVVAVSGTLLPRPELFTHITDAVALQEVRARLQEEGIPFYVSGEVTAPGISFGAFAPWMSALENGVGR